MAQTTAIKWTDAWRCKARTNTPRPAAMAGFTETTPHHTA